MDNNIKTTTIVCFGDSITQGNVSYNWVNDLAAELKLQNKQVQNFGVNGDLSYNALKRIDAVIKCQPTIITILLGTNDVNASTSTKKTNFYINRNKLPQHPSKAWYVENMEAIITQFQQKTKAKIVLITLPILGEDIGGVANELVQEYNIEIKRLAQKYQVELLDFNAEMVNYLQQKPPQKSRPLAQNYYPVVIAVLRHYLLFQSWDKVTQKQGFVLLTDGIHLNEKSGKMLLDLVRTVC